MATSVSTLAAWPSKSLLLSERFSKTAAPTSRFTDPHNMVALKRDTEGFQFAIYNPTDQTSYLNARVTGLDPAVNVDIRRVAFVYLEQGSTGLGTRPGYYADPLPPLRPSGGRAGLLEVAPASWAGFMVTAVSAQAGYFAGTLEVTNEDGNTVASQALSLSVKNVSVPVSGAIKSVIGFEGFQYWGPDQQMRQNHDRINQLQGAFDLLSDHRFSPSTYSVAESSKAGSYGCLYDRQEASRSRNLTTTGFLLQQYLANTPWSLARILPTSTSGCNPDKSGGEYSMTKPAGDPSIRQDDLLDSGASAFATRVFDFWRRAGLVNRNAYVKNPFDEPSNETAPMRKTMQTQVPLANEILHRKMPGVKTALSAWPQDERKINRCKTVSGKRSCMAIQQDAYGNRKMWDGIGQNETDVWIVPQLRLYGRLRAPQLHAYGWDRHVEYKNRLQRLKALRGGREVWVYNFYTASRNLPQLSIDAPSTDAQLSYWQLAKEGHTGLYISNSILGWGFSQNMNTGRYAYELLPGTNLARKSNPYEKTPYFWHRNFGYAAGWGTFLYPPYSPRYGLVEPSDLEGAAPVSSLRMENMRQGSETADLIALYRKKYGEAKTQAMMRPIFGTTYRSIGGAHKSVVWPVYSNHNMATRMETQRRLMIAAL